MAVSVPSLTSVHTVVGVYDEGVIDIAKSIVSGIVDDYYVFNYSDSITIVLVGDLDFVNGSVTSDSCSAYVIERFVDRTPLTRTEQSTFSGTIVGANPSTFSGSNQSVRTVDFDTKVSYQLASGIVSNVEVYNTEQTLYYSSFPNSPHLTEGVENYAFAAFVLAFTVISYRLASAISSRCIKAHAALPSGGKYLTPQEMHDILGGS